MRRCFLAALLLTFLLPPLGVGAAPTPPTPPSAYNLRLTDLPTGYRQLTGRVSLAGQQQAPAGASADGSVQVSDLVFSGPRRARVESSITLYQSARYASAGLQVSFYLALSSLPGKVSRLANLLSPRDGSLGYTSVPDATQAPFFSAGFFGQRGLYVVRLQISLPSDAALPLLRYLARLLTARIPAPPGRPVSLAVLPRQRTLPSFTLASPSAAMAWGTTVALSGDGATALIGAPGYNNPASPDTTTDPGHAYLLTRAGGAWSMPLTLEGETTPGAGFGAAVALSTDGSTALVAIPQSIIFIHGKEIHERGVVFVYQRTSAGVWSAAPVATLVPPAPASPYSFGQSVALSASGTTALVSSASALYVYTRTPGGPWSNTPVATLSGDSFGTDAFGSVALSADGAVALGGDAGAQATYGAVEVPEQGAALVYARGGGGWKSTGRPTAMLTTDTIGDSSFFGTAVALSADGRTALVTAAGPTLDSPGGSGYVFTQTSSGLWVLAATLTGPRVQGSGFGEAAALSADGLEALIGAPPASKPSLGDIMNLVPFSVAGVGMAYLYRQTSAGDWNPNPQAVLSSPAGIRTNLGEALALSTHGDEALVGTESAGGKNGRAYGFSLGQMQTPVALPTASARPTVAATATVITAPSATTTPTTLSTAATTASATPTIPLAPNATVTTTPTGAATSVNLPTATTMPSATSTTAPNPNVTATASATPTTPPNPNATDTMTTTPTPTM
jgi:hypothetical protein